MTLLELKARKAELIQAILNDVDNEEVLNELSDVLKKNTIKHPGLFSVLELNERADKAIRNCKAGKGIPHEMIQRKVQ